ncbi:MAG: PAS domain S-box protein [Candidatus Thiodiazotropha sp. (ex Dulcina madagascariensis)]|nr:PAS domain S-box protein [Candidatus Thiodiazotropha sp. (ex Dulcina madagascariensis)]MCU7928578.1 PAS domain S-box protein [Candidatus Thiodiazotropha sp. (ex Dulcina madagascariensis)]
MPPTFRCSYKAAIAICSTIGWNIDQNHLPADSLVLNRPFSFYDEYKTLVWGTITALLLLSSIIFLLANNIAARRRAELALRAARDNLEREIEDRTRALRERDLRLLLENIPLRVFYKNRDHVYVTCNSAFAQDFALDYQALRGKTDFDLQSEETARLYRANDLNVMSQGRTLESEGSYSTHEKTIKIHTIKAPVRDEQGEVVGLLGIFWDITEKHEAKKALEESEARFRSLFQNSKAVQLLIDPDGGRIIDANRAAENYYGYHRKRLLRMSILEINMLSEQEVLAEMNQAKAEERDHFFFRHRLADGEVRDVEVHSGPINLQGRSLLYSIIHDVTDAWLSASLLKGRNHVLELLTRNASEREMLTAVIEYVELVQKHIADAADVSLLAQRIIKAIDSPFTALDHRVSVGVSIGVQLVKRANESCDTILANADLALYRAKEMGRGQFVFYQDVMTRKLQFEVELVNHITQALDEGEIYVVYQSQHDLSDGRLSGFEALARWRHRKWGVITPSEFVPIAEKRGVINRIGEYVLRSACTQARQ